MKTVASFDLQDVSFAVPGRQLLAPLSLQMHPGKMFGLIGHNGSGKSTLIKLLARQQPVSAGSIRFGDQALGKWGNRAFARKIAYLPQSLPATNGMLVRELVALGRFPWHGALGRFGVEDRAKVQEAMGLTDTLQFAEQTVETLSGGERQRVFVAMMVAQDAEWLLLDEPISALDIAHQIEVLTLVSTLCRDRRLGVMVVLHDINMAARFCDEIIALHSGRLVGRGPVQEMIKPAQLAAIYDVPMGTIPHPSRDSEIVFAL